jgi:hypothetical protein
MIRFIGDVHGKFGRYKTLLADSPFPTIQVGDMGVGFRKWPHGEWSANPPYDQMKAGGHRFIRGNHDNPEVCAMHSQWIPDGTVEGDMMFIGGALSIDRAYRYEDFSWWPDEELSQQRLDALVHEFAIVRPKIMVTHECPESIAEMIVGDITDLRDGKKMKMDPRHASRTRVAFQTMFEAHQPKLWIFGHWHVPFGSVINGTRFICLPELAHMDIDPEHLP